MGELRTMDPSGDIKMAWNRSNPWEVHQAKEQFRKLRGKGYIAHRVSPKGVHEEIKEFDPDADSIIMSPMPVGG